MKICIIGNSHIACLREAWFNENKSVDVKFFGSHSLSLFETTNDNNNLKPTSDLVLKNFKMTSEGQEEIKLEQFDIIVLHGLMDRPIVFRDYLNNLQSDQFYSRQVIEATNPFKQSLANHVIKEIRKTSNITIYVSHIPYPSEEKAYNKIDSQYHYSLHKEMKDTIESISNVHFFEQPAETIVDLNHTIAEFSKGSKRLDVANIQGGEEHPEDDYNHMNAEFGRIYMKNLITVLNNNLTISGAGN